MSGFYVAMVIVGIVIGAGSIVFVRKTMMKHEKNAWGVSLILVAGIYVLFLLRGGEGNWLWIEPAGVLLYGFFAIIGMTLSPIMLGIGWLLHAFWDAGLHSGDSAHFVPSWYPGFCLGYDLVLGFYLLTRTRAWEDLEGVPVHQASELPSWRSNFIRYVLDYFDDKSDAIDDIDFPD